MEQSKYNQNSIYDFINNCPESHYTQIANEVLRCDSISFKARGILCRMLSNSNTWKSSIAGLCSLGTEGEHAINTGIKELEDAGFLLRIRYSDKKKKAVKGSLWVYTHHANQFNIKIVEKYLDELGMVFLYNRDKLNLNSENHIEGSNLNSENLNEGNLNSENLNEGYQGVSNIEYNKDLKNKDNIEKVNKTSSSDLGNIVKSQFELFWKKYPKKANKGKALSKWESICNKPIKERPKWKEILKAVHAQKKTGQWQNPKFIPHAATWLNQNQWMNDPESMISYEGRDKGDQFGKGQGNNRSLSKIPIEYKVGRKV